MESLWAPWRMEWIAKEMKDCIFCRIPKEERDEENLLLRRLSTCFVLLNRFPYNNGHLMIAPYRHVPSLEDLKEEEGMELFRASILCLKAIREAMKPDGFNLGINIGKAAGAGFEGHVHLHIVPRWVGDTNFMPVIGRTKVISEALKDTYAKLWKVLPKMSE
ncbi:HIT domain-containing protein [Candidatus Bathyarchaeota archaeon]|nr:HIT domain-containing protein [Candidatus Bathyarchaeota archaeon]MBS7627853.1 HIT domain-containing protein [Candidatus Bathyarchaeota archaeon]